MILGGLDSNDRRQAEWPEHTLGWFFLVCGFFFLFFLFLENRDNEKTAQIFLTDQFSISLLIPRMLPVLSLT